jgi:hypothetical protein
MTQSRRLDGAVDNPGSAARDDRDIFRLAPSMDATVLETIAARTVAILGVDHRPALIDTYLTRRPE